MGETASYVTIVFVSSSLLIKIFKFTCKNWIDRPSIRPHFVHIFCIQHQFRFQQVVVDNT